MAEFFAVPRREQGIFLHRTCSLDNFTDQQVVNRYRLDRGSIVDIERGYATSEFATKTRRSNAVNEMAQVILQHLRFGFAFAFGKLSKPNQKQSNGCLLNKVEQGIYQTVAEPRALALALALPLVMALRLAIDY